MINKHKKIGILTLNGYHNYGNRLQNFALEESINLLGCKAETIIVDRFNKKQDTFKKN